MVFLIFFSVILYSIHNHYQQTRLLIEKSSLANPSISGPGTTANIKGAIGQSDIQELRQHLFSLVPGFCATIILYLPVALLIFFISFAAAVGSAYNPFSRMAPFANGFIQLVDSIPLVLWVFIAVIIVFRGFAHSVWGYYLSVFYYPVLSLSYGMVLIVIFFQQDRRIITEIRSQNILNGEIVSGINNQLIIFRMFWFHFAKTIMIRQLIYAFLYILLFDYCLMYIFEDFRQSGYAMTPLTVKAGLFFKRLNYYKLLHMPDRVEIYSHLHTTSFYLILLLALVCFFILFFYFDRKDITND